MAAWICESCAGENPDATRFCGHCGAPRVQEPPPQADATRAKATARITVGSALREHVSEEAATRFAQTQGRFAEERRLITALFADISGFTALAQRVDTEELVEIIDPLVARLGAVVARYEGTVEKYAGDAILAIFGAPLAHDDDAARALLVAIEMHRELERAAPALGPGAEGLALHVGVNSGHAIARVMGSEARLDYGVLGDSVIIAQRLESQAPGGETYVGASTVALVGDRFRFEPLGDLAVKGKAEPVPAWRLVGTATSLRRIDAPAWTGVGTDAPLVGREDELARVTAALDAVAAGRGGIVSLVGEPGIGKSTLVSAAAASAVARGLEWLVTRCVSYGRALSYGPYVELVRSRSGIDIDDPPPEAARRLAHAPGGPAWVAGRPYFSWLLGLPATDPERIAPLEPEAFRRALHAAFVDWLGAVGEPQRVLVLEDIQWADDASLSLTQELVQATSGAPLLVLLSGRPEATDQIRALAAAVVEAAPPTRLDLVLETFDQTDTARLIRSHLDSDPSRELATFLHERTGGNPFFVVETVRALSEAGAITTGREGAGLDPGWDRGSVPPTVEGLLAARIDRLTTGDREFLQMASVLGRHIHESMLRGLLDDPPDLEPTIARLVDAGLLDHVGDDGEHLAIFHHALVQDVAYSRLLRRRRRALHLRAADTAQRLYGEADAAIDLLAGHLYLARAGARAVEALQRAAARARRLFANEEAILALQRAEELALEGTETADALVGIRLELAALHELVGAYEQAIRRYEEVRDAAGDPAAWRGLAGARRRLGEYDAAVAIAEEGLAAIGRSADPRPLILERAAALSVSGRRAEAIRALEAGLEAHPSDDDATAGHLLLQLARARTVAGAPTDAIPLAERAVAILDGTDDLPGAATASRVLGNAYSSAGRLDDADRTLRRGLAIAERVGSSEEIGGCLINLGVLAMDRQRTDEAIEWYRRAVDEFERSGHASGRVTGYANLADALLVRGDLDEALARARQAVDAARSLGHALGLADALDTMAAIHGRRDELSRAAELAQEAARAYAAAGATVRQQETLLAASAWRAAAGDPGDHSKPLRPGGPSSRT